MRARVSVNPPQLYVNRCVLIICAAFLRTNAQARVRMRAHKISAEMLHLKPVALTLQLIVRGAVNLSPGLGVDVSGAGARTTYPAEVRCARKSRAKE